MSTRRPASVFGEWLRFDKVIGTGRKVAGVEGPPRPSLRCASFVASRQAAGRWSVGIIEFACSACPVTATDSLLLGLGAASAGQPHEVEFVLLTQSGVPRPVVLGRPSALQMNTALVYDLLSTTETFGRERGQALRGDGGLHNNATLSSAVPTGRIRGRCISVVNRTGGPASGR